MTSNVIRTGLLVCALAVSGCGDTPQAPGPVLPGPPPAAPAPGPPPPPPVGTHPFAGTYSLTITIGQGCTAVPEAERIRTYTARFDPAGEGTHVISLTNASFLTGPICTGGGGRFAGIGCHQFFAHDDAAQMQFVLANNNDEAHGGHIVEQTAAGTWLEIIGEAIAPRDPSLMEAAGRGNVWRCPESRDYPFPCSSFVSCRDVDLRLKLTRR